MVEQNISLIYYRHNKYGDYYGFPQRVIPYYDLTIVLKGKMDYICDKVHYSLNGGDIIFCPKGTVQIRTASKNPADYVSFNYNTNDNINLNITNYIKNGASNEIKALISLYDECVNNKSDNTEEKCKSLLKYLILQIADIIKSQSENPLVNNIKKYLLDNIHQKIQLKDIRDTFFFSPVYCDSIFKKETGYSIIDYLINERIEEAKRLIFEGAYSLSHISEIVGFKDYNYFSRVFKNRTGYSPKIFKVMTR